jgi:TonB family protein
MPLILITAAAAVQMATQISDKHWVEPSDYPQSALKNGNSGYVGFSLLIGPDGKPDRCLITAPVRSVELNRSTCQLAMRRARFKPAMDGDARAAFAILRGTTAWLIGDSPAAIDRLKARYPYPNDIDLTVSVPMETVPPPLELTIAVDASGKVTVCQDQEAKVDPAWTKAACGQVYKLWKPVAMSTKAGQMVPTIQNVKVEFRTEKSHNP